MAGAPKLRENDNWLCCVELGAGWLEDSANIWNCGLGSPEYAVEVGSWPTPTGEPNRFMVALEDDCTLVPDKKPVLELSPVNRVGKCPFQGIEQ